MSTPPSRLQDTSPELARVFASLRRNEPGAELVAKILAIPEHAPLASRPPTGRALPTLARWIVGGICTLAVVGIGAGWIARRHGVASAEPMALAPSAHAPEVMALASPDAPSPSNASSESTISVNDLPSARGPSVAPPKASSAGSYADGSTFHEELALVEAARAALARGDAASSLRTLDTYDRRFQDGALAAEAEITRIEALAAGGRRDEGRRLAERFLQKNGASPYGARVRAMLAKWNTRGASPAVGEQDKDTSR